MQDGPEVVEAAGKGRRGNLFWLILLLIVVAVWWFWRRPADNGVAAHAPTVQELMGSDPDDILVDVRDDASDADVAALEQAAGVDLVLVSDQAKDERLYRAHVPADRRDALLATIAALPNVEVAEPDAQVSLSPWSATAVGDYDDARARYQALRVDAAPGDLIGIDGRRTVMDRDFSPPRRR